MVFGIIDARGYREKVRADLEELATDISNPSAGINVFTSTFHFHEWIWRFQLKPMTPCVCRGEVLRRIDDFRAWLDGNCPHFQLIQDLTNGSKHATPVHSSGQVGGYGAGPWGIGPWGGAYLLIDLGESSMDDRFLVASEVVKESAGFLIKLSEELEVHA